MREKGEVVKDSVRENRKKISRHRIWNIEQFFKEIQLKDTKCIYCDKFQEIQRQNESQQKYLQTLEVSFPYHITRCVHSRTGLGP